MPFGRFEGRPLAEIPRTYLEWYGDVNRPLMTEVDKILGLESVDYAEVAALRAERDHYAEENELLKERLGAALQCLQEVQERLHNFCNVRG